MSLYIKRQISKILKTLAPFAEQIEQTTPNPHNTSGYGYLPTDRCNTHALKDGSYIKEGLSFDSGKAATVPYFAHYTKEGSLIKQYL